MAEDDDVIYVSIEPKLDESATEKETGKLRDKFKEGAKGLGKGISDVLHSELAEDLGRTLGPLARDAGIQLGKELGGQAGDYLHGQISDALKGIGVDFDDILGKARDFGDVFKDFKSGDTAKGVSDLTAALSKVPGPLGEVAGKSKGLLDTYDSLKGEIKATTDEFQTFAGNAPRFAGALETIGKAAGPVALTLGALASVDKDFGSNLDRLLGDLQNHNLPDALKAGGGMMWDSLKMPFEWFAPPGTSRTETHTPRQPGQMYPWWPQGTPNLSQGGNFLPGLPDAIAGGGGVGGAPSIAPPDTGGAPAHTSGFSAGGLPHVTLADFNVPSGPEGLTTAGGNVANLYRVAESLQGTPYSKQLRDDCSGIVSELAAAAAGLPAPSPGQRFSTVNEGSSLAAMGFLPGLGGPNDFNVGWYDHGGGDFGHTAATLPGGVNAEQGGSHDYFMLGNGAAGASNPEFNQHAHLPMSGGGFHPAGYGGGMPFAPSLGAYAPPPTQPNQAGGQSQQQQLGHGSGVGVGGGVIGLAEQAGAMAAGAMSFGGGAMAAQIIEQEMNLAVQKGGQMAAVGAMAPIETLWLHGGQLGAPAVQQPSWPGKILSGLIGQQFSSPNIAGATQPPKQVDNKEDSQDQGGQSQAGQGNGQGTSKDNPLHVSVTNQPAGPQQGAATSAMSGLGYMSALTA